MKGENVWYAAYGSNLFRNRFLCYIHGGQPEGAERREPGCRDKSLPKDETSIILNHQFYFAKHSTKWKGGIGFIKPGKEAEQSCYAKMYLITREQFCDVVKQENQLPENILIDFDACKEKGSLLINQKAYGTLLYLDEKDGYPIYTFTNGDCLDPQKPSPAYLKMIVAGLKESHDLTRAQITEYLLMAPGVRDNFTLADLSALL